MEAAKTALVSAMLYEAFIPSLCGLIVNGVATSLVGIEFIGKIFESSIIGQLGAEIFDVATCQIEVEDRPLLQCR